MSPVALRVRVSAGAPGGVDPLKALYQPTAGEVAAEVKAWCVRAKWGHAGADVPGCESRWVGDGCAMRVCVQSAVVSEL